MNTVIAQTTKGHRVWIQGTASYGWPIGTRYNTVYSGNTILLCRATEGKRKVSKGKGGIIDLVGKKVTQWAQGATVVHIDVTHDTIHIDRV